MLGIPIQWGKVRAPLSPLLSAWKESRIHWSKKLFHQRHPLSCKILECPLILGENEILSLIAESQYYQPCRYIAPRKAEATEMVRADSSSFAFTAAGDCLQAISHLLAEELELPNFKNRACPKAIICTLQEKSLNLWGGVTSVWMVNWGTVLRPRR